jgi:hypothetical protein
MPKKIQKQKTRAGGGTFAIVAKISL